MSGTIGTDDAFEWAGGTGSFYDPKQWIDLSDPKNTGTAYPASEATVTFTSGEVTDSGGNSTVLTVSGNMTFDSGMQSGTTTNNGTVFLSSTASELFGDSLDNTGQISGPGGVIFSNTEVIGSITNGGSIDVASLRGDTIDNMSQIAVGFLNVVATLTNSGSVTLSGISANAQIGTLINKGHIDLGSAGVDIGNLINTGTFTAGNAASISATSADLGGSVFVGGGTTLAVFGATTATVESGTSVQALGAAFNSDTLVAKSGGVVDATDLDIGGTVESGGIVIGGNGGGTNLETLTAAGKITANGFDLNVNGSVSVTGSIAVTSGGNVLIGPAATLDIAGGTMSTGKSVLAVAHLVNVHGAGSLLTNDQQMAIGVDAPSSAPGTVEVTNQGSISGNDVYMGDDTLATGLGIVNAATWTNSGLVSIGIIGSGTLEVENAGTFTAGSGIVLGGSMATATGTLTIDGAGSLVHAGGGLVVLAGSTAIVTNSASLSTGSTGASDSIGTFPSGTVEAEVELTSNATWTSATAIDVGLGTITIGGGTLASATVNIGTDSTLGASALVSASGTDSHWTNSGSIVVGGDAAGTLELATGAVLNASGDVIAGGATDGDGTITVDGTLSVGGNLIVGQDGTGTITVDGAATTLSVGGNLIVGQDGTGSLDLSHSVAISVDGTLQVGGTIGTGTVTDTGADPPRHFGALAINNGVANVAPGAANPWLVDRGTAQNIDIGGVAGGNATLALPQTGTVVAGSGTVTIGGAGNGNLTLLQNALFDAAVNDVTVGDESTSNGVVTVAGTGALLEAANLTAGDLGAAQVTVSGGGSLEVTGTLSVGDNSGAGTIDNVIITDDGSDATAGALSVGGSGVGTLLVAGATLSVSGDGAVGEASGGAGTMTVNAGSVDVSGTLTVGDAGNGLLLIGLGGTLSVDSLEIGNKLGGKGEVDVTGAGALLTGTDISVGSGGKGTLKITGARVNTTGNVNVADQVKGSVQSLTVDQQSQWTVGGTLTVGTAGIASATVKGASLVAVNGDVVVGDQAGAGGVLTVTGSLGTGGTIVPSEISFAGALTVGNAGDGSLAVQQGAEAVATSGGKGEIDIAVLAGETSSATVTGAGSMLQGKSLAVGGGASAAGGHGTLSIASGGLVRVADAHVWGSGRVVLTGGTLATDPTTLDAGGTIDGSGMVSGAIADAGVISASDGSLVLTGGVTGGGMLEAQAGGALDLRGTVANTLTLDFPADGGTLLLGALASVQAPIAGFGTDDAIGIDGQAVTGFSYDTLDNGLTLDGSGGAKLALTLVGSYTQGSFAIRSGELVIPCFVRGTHIATPGGECCVETLRVGDAVRTASGGVRPVVWIGHRRVDCRRHPKPQDVEPVRVQAGTFGAGMPRRDLLLSPDHAVFVDGALIPIRYLINDATIVQVPFESVGYWHVELDRHDVILAEGLRCESYLDTGNRGAFENGGAAVHMHADFARTVWEHSSCAPLVLDGAQLEAARSYLLERAGTLGYAMTNDAALRLLVDGRELKPRITGRSHRFRLPANARHTRVASRSAVPAHVRDDSSDHRRLGVAISRVALDGEPIALGDPRLGSGWHDVEPGWRWTDGDAALALAGVRELAFDVVMAGRYWVARVAACPLPSFMETTFRRTSGTKSLRRTRRDGLR